MLRARSFETSSSKSSSAADAAWSDPRALCSVLLISSSCARRFCSSLDTSRDRSAAADRGRAPCGCDAPCNPKTISEAPRLRVSGDERREVISIASAPNSWRASWMACFTESAKYDLIFMDEDCSISCLPDLSERLDFDFRRHFAVRENRNVRESGFQKLLDEIPDGGVHQHHGQ